MIFTWFLLIKLCAAFTFSGTMELSGKVVRFKRKISAADFESQKRFCQEEGGWLPNPQNKEDNDKLAALGPTWIETPNYQTPPVFANTGSYTGENEKTLYFDSSILAGKWVRTNAVESVTCLLKDRFLSEDINTSNYFSKQLLKSVSVSFRANSFDEICVLVDGEEIQCLADENIQPNKIIEFPKVEGLVGKIISFIGRGGGGWAVLLDSPRVITKLYVPKKEECDFNTRHNPGASGFPGDPFCVPLDPSDPDFNAEDEAKRACPSNACWIWSIKERKCVLDPSKPGCGVELKCSAEEMAIKWVTENIFGNHLKIMESYCEPEPDEGPYDMNWHKPLGSCGQSVSKHPVTKKIQFKKAITYTRGSFKSANLASEDDNDVEIILKNAYAIKVTFTCNFDEYFTAHSKDIAIQTKGIHGHAIEADGSWDGSFDLKFKDKHWTTDMSRRRFTLASTMYVQAMWKIANKALGDKLNWYLNKCVVGQYDHETQAISTTKQVSIIDNMCYADLFKTDLRKNQRKIATEKFDFSYKSFSFNTRISDEQAIQCDIRFCLKDSECGNVGKNIECDSNSPYQWVDRPEK